MQDRRRRLIRPFGSFVTAMTDSPFMFKITADMDVGKSKIAVRGIVGAISVGDDRSGNSLWFLSSLRMRRSSASLARRFLRSEKIWKARRDHKCFGLFRFLSSRSGAEQVAKRRQSLDMVTHDFSNRQQWHGEQRAWYAPQPVPEHQR